ncbi:hypothetical protein [Geomicrobium sp. JCM 19038]|uniref:hypothetical protein n=1 Tax=Geomicrobium sp. JCM 19038 TaxID=1460635 RepID=UPI00045F3B57|nr:hypothetical protein [Geomicrobium sp. JCM 19038]GAK08969.1 hypothetical protein JCM19038_2774 [Geomicrobium sp. JCM 19038]
MSYYRDWCEPEVVLEPKFKRKQYRTTEEILNADYWINADGEKLNLEGMDKDHLRNVLHFLYKKRSYLWLHCDNAEMISEFNDPDEFFDAIVLSSTLWNTILSILHVPNQGFNFEWTSY